MSIRKLIAAAAAVSLLAVPAVTLAADPLTDDAAAQDVGFGFKPKLANIEPPETGLVNSVINIINALLVLAAIAAVVFMIIGGVRYVTAQGDEDAVELAKNTVIYAIIGIIVILLAAVIVNFFVSQVGA